MSDGLSPLSEAPSLEGMNTEERIDAMMEWFFENFEDPANETPYNSREGGYLYIHGGPFEAADYIYNAFPDATEEEQQSAIDQIEAQGPEFAPAGHRVEAPEEPDDFLPFPQPPLPPPLNERLEALGGQLEEIRSHVLAIQAIRPPASHDPYPGVHGIGHNNPPREDEAGAPDLDEVLATIDAVEVELAKPNAAEAADEAVIEGAEGVFSKFWKWIKDIVKDVPTVLAKGAMGYAGKEIAEYVWLHHEAILHHTGMIVQTLVDWAIVASPMPF